MICERLFSKKHAINLILLKFSFRVSEKTPHPRDRYLSLDRVYDSWVHIAAS